MDDPQLDQGGVYNLLVARDPETNKVAARLYTLTSPNSIHILWQFPQYFIITSFGNVIVIIVAEAKAFNDQASEFFFAALMLLDTFIMIFLAWR